MKIWKLSWILFFCMVSLPLFAAAEKSPESAVDLVTGSEEEQLEAIRKTIKDKDKSRIPQLIETLSTTQNPRIASEAAIALGLLGEKGDSTTALKKKIEATENGDIVYACLLSLYNLHRKDKKADPEVEASIRFSLENRKQDAYVVDLLDKIKEKLLKNS